MSSTVDAKKLQADESTNKKTDNINFHFISGATNSVTQSCLHDLQMNSRLPLESFVWQWQILTSKK